jgi:glucan phosphoethanolaminetransferase (alkaline phosphatase superfamily)
MLQRIQTIFLSVIIASMIVLCLVPIWTKSDPEAGYSYAMYAWHLQEINPTNTSGMLIRQPYVGIGVFAVIAAILALYALLRYDNRLRQLQICALNSLVLTGMLGCMVYGAFKNDAKLLTHVKGHYHIGFIAVVIAIISNLLANQFIKKDERLVRESEKIR